jgi:hypothetical protein
MTRGSGDAIFWVAVACCAVAQAAIVRAVLRPLGAAAAGAVPRPRRVAEVIWVLLPALGLALALVATWRRMHPDADAERRTPASARAAAGPVRGSGQSGAES